MTSSHKVDLDQQMAIERLLRMEEAIIHDFADAALDEIEAASKVSPDGLIDSLPNFLEALRASLKDGPTSTNKQAVASIGSAHGTVRANQRAFSREDLFVEYRILGRVILKRLREGAHLNDEVEDIILDSVLTNLGNAVTNFIERKDYHQKDFRNLERLKLIKSLEHSNQELEKFFSEADSPMFMTVGRNHRCILSNAAFSELVNLKPEGERFSNLFDKDAASEFMKAMDQTFLTKKSFISDEIYLTETEKFHIYLHPYLDLHGEVKGVMGLLQNVKSKKIFLKIKHA